MRALTIAALPTLLALAAAPAVAQDAKAHIAAGDAARCQRSIAGALGHFREALALDSLNYEANWKASRELADSGVVIVMISSDMEEILGVSDRIAVMHEGQITGILTRDKFEEEAVMRLAVGQTSWAGNKDN